MINRRRHPPRAVTGGLGRRGGVVPGLATGAAANPMPVSTDPCTGACDLPAERDRPTVADYACGAHPGRTIVEPGYAHIARRPQGTPIHCRQSAVRPGLAGHNDCAVVPPDCPVLSTA